jgi:hypothetical protein
MSSPITVLYDSTDITAYVIFKDASFDLQMNGMPGSFDFRCKDENQELDFITGHTITLLVDDVPMWGGYVMQVERGYAFPADVIPADVNAYRNRIWHLRGVDYNILFDKRVLHNDADPLKAIPSITEFPFWDGDLITDTLCPLYLDLPVELDFSTYVENIREETVADLVEGTHSWAWVSPGTKWREQMARFTIWTGALMYIDASMNLHYQALDTAVKRWGFSDVPNYDPITVNPDEYQGATIGPREVSAIQDGTSLVNEAFVWGGGEFAGAAGGTLSAHYINTDSRDLHGLWQFAETHFGEMQTQTLLDLRAAIIVDGPPGATAIGQDRGLSNEQLQFRLTWFAHDVPLLSGSPDHLIPGQIADLNLNVFDYDKLLPLRSLRISFPNLNELDDGNAYVRFDGFFGLQPDDPYTLWAFLRGEQAKVEALNNAPERVAVADDSSGGSTYGAAGYFVPTPTPDGIKTVFQVSFGYIAGTAEVYLNGLTQRRNIDFIESDHLTGGFTMTSAPLVTDNLLLFCRVLG